MNTPINTIPYEPPQVFVVNEIKESNNCPGLPELIALANQNSIRVAIDLRADEFDDLEPFEEVSPENVVFAVNEVDEARLLFEKTYDDGSIKVCKMLVIAENGDDWLCDYTYFRKDPWLDDLVHAAARKDSLLTKG